MAETTNTSSKLKFNLKNVVWGEVVGSVVALGSVFVARKVLPNQTEQITQRLSSIIEKQGKKSPEESRASAERVIDVVLMNLGGIASEVTQFSMRRMASKKQDNTLVMDLSSMIAGRIAGTSTMTAGLYATEKYASQPLRSSEETLAKGINWISSKAQGKNTTPPAPDEQRAAYVLISNVMQSIFAVPGRVTAQTFLDKEMAKHKQRKEEALQR